jgi:uncharacterized protein involved in exopolysaccharide biosynthesis
LGLLEGRLAKTDELAAQLPQVEVEYSDLTRRLEAAKVQHGSLHKRLKEKELQLDFERASVAARYEIIRQPHALAASKARTAAKRAAIGGAVGLLLGVVFAVFHWLVAYSKQRGLERGAAATSIVRG